MNCICPVCTPLLPLTQHCCGYAGVKESGLSGEEETTETFRLSLEGWQRHFRCQENHVVSE